MFKHYNNVADFLLACENGPAKQSWGSTQKSRTNSDGFAGCSYDTAIEMSRDGWEKGLKDVSERMALVAHNTQPRPGIIKSVAGHSPDVARFVVGLPDCMNRKAINEAKRKPCIDIVVNASYNGGVEAKNILNYGAALASLIDSLEALGYSLSIKAGLAISCMKGTKGFLVSVKDHGQRLDIGRMAYFVGHVSFLRRLGFSWIENHLIYQKDVGSGYGSTDDMPEDSRGNLYFGQDTLNSCRDMTSAMAYVQKKVKAQMPDLLEAA